MAGDFVRPLAPGVGGFGRAGWSAVAGALSTYDARGASRLARATSGSRFFGAVAFLGAATLAIGVVAGVDRAWAAWLLASFGVLTAGLAGLIFIAIQYASGASWSVALRRIPEALTAAIPVGGAAVLALVVFRPGPYPWSHGLEAHEGAELLAAFKTAWLSWPFFAGRAIFYVLVWIAFARGIVTHSRRQDEDGSNTHTTRNITLSIAGIVAFAVTFSLASFDWIMSIEPEWYSTIFAVYNFAGLFSSGLAMIVILAVWLQRGPLRFVVRDEHLHDLGKLLFAFSTFWMYIWFSQYMLIWYANLPEETGYFITRTRGAYWPLFIVNMLLNWLLPFLVLLRRPPKRRPEILVKIAIVVLVGRWLDLYLMIVPPFSPAGPPFGVWEIASVLALGGGVAWITVGALGRARLVPIGDPQLIESLHYHT